jgi:predicted nuclease of predicted toxin-antitoxin system
LKLLLDEMMRHAIAEQLRARGHDVVAVTERPDLRSTPDGELMERAQTEGRAIVTYNYKDFILLDRDSRRAGRSHAGIVIMSSHRFPEGKSTAQQISSLEAFINVGEPYPGFILWLE